MKKIFLLIILYILLIQYSLHSQWMQYSTGTSNSLFSIHFVDTSYGFAVGGYAPNSIVKTTNEGLNWTIININLLTYLYSVYFLNALTGFVSGGPVAIVKTTDGGNSWNPVIIGGNGSVNSINFISSDTGIAVGGVSQGIMSRGIIFKTSNQGNLWSYLIYGYRFLKSVFFVNPLTGYAGGEYGILIKTTDAGANWETLFESGIFNDAISSINFINAYTGFAISGYALHKTTNGGINWSNEQPAGSSIFFIDSINGYIVSGRTIVKTSNSGNNWVNQFSVSTQNLTQVYFVNSNYGYVGGSGGIILKTTNGGEPVGINFLSNEISSFFSLSQNFPNPFNPKTIINYELRITSYVTLKVYNSIGKEIRILTNQRQNAGEYKVEFDGSDLQSGVYFYRMKVEGDNHFVMTKRMVLIK